MQGYGNPPHGWVITSEKLNSEYERIGLAECPEHPQFGGTPMLCIWDDPVPQGSGRCAPMLFDRQTRDWLREQLSRFPDKD